MTYINKANGIRLTKNASKSIGSIDGIIFDCDGVLVDVSKSYDLAIKQTTAFVLQKFANIKSIPITSQIICGFKESGGFNDEVDVTYAAILSLVAAKKIGANPKKFIAKVIENADETGIESVEKFLDKIDLSEIKKKLDYPGPHSTNPLYIIFDQIFYGPKLYKKIFHKKSQFTKRGLIENDRVLLTKRLLAALKQRYGKKIAIVTGRGRASTSYSLGSLFKWFDLKNSVFLEDESRKLAKPNPKPLMTAADGLKAKHCLYVGDSMEDLIMAKKANGAGRKITFCAIYGTGTNPAEKVKFFMQNKAPMILKSINHLPKALNLANQT
ncbi:MAG TPA: HAD-IA family hydrolase [Candidatus Nitrosotenuis sp.]|nr:HAD-IA family hydrolase [Candidatus Nitrosotenuis sp.]